MKLSEAIMLGDSLRTRLYHCWLSEKKEDGTLCGCALGGAALAIGETRRHLEESDFYAMWPWLTEEIITEISHRFESVCCGWATFESLVDYVRSVEPKEQECDSVSASGGTMTIQVNS
jgi:hypothetical protein